MNSGPMPLKVRRTAAGDCASSACDARSASRCVSTVLTCSRRSSSRSSSRLSRCFRQIGRGRPSPVLSVSSFWRRSRRTGSYSVMPCANRSPFMRLTFLTRSAVRDRRSRLICRRSSCSGVGAFAMAQTRGSPRLWASKALTKAAPSTPSVLTRRRRRDVAMEAGSTTWLSMFAFSRVR